MSIFPINFGLDDSLELKALMDSINGSVKVALERLEEATDACNRVEPRYGDGTEEALARRDYRLADEALQVALRLQRRVNYWLEAEAMEVTV